MPAAGLSGAAHEGRAVGGRAGLYIVTLMEPSISPRLVKIGEAAYDCRIDRQSKWGNPYHIGIHGTRGEVIEAYEVHVRGRADLMAALPELAGKVLGCHCAPKRCHGEILLKLLKEAGLE